jgi:HSP20 family protein
MLQLFNRLPLASAVRSSWANDLFRELDRFMVPGADAPFEQSTRINVHVNEDTAKVIVSVPGWKPEWFDLSHEGNQLRIKGASQFEADSRSNMTLDRVVNLPFHLDNASVEAMYKDGLLVVTLHRSEEDKPRKINVNVA